jgi:hypothetical protein
MLPMWVAGGLSVGGSIMLMQACHAHTHTHTHKHKHKHTQIHANIHVGNKNLPSPCCWHPSHILDGRVTCYNRVNILFVFVCVNMFACVSVSVFMCVCVVCVTKNLSSARCWLPSYILDGRVTRNHRVNYVGCSRMYICLCVSVYLFV